MPTLKKEQTVQSLKKLVDESKSVIIAEYRGMKMKDFNALRAKLRPEGVVFQVVKNTLLRRAAEGSTVASIAEGLEGPNAAAFSLNDAVAAARLISDFIRETKSPLVVKSGVVDGQVYDAAGVSAIAKLPPKEQLLAMLVGGLQAPISNLAGTAQTMISSLVWTLSSVAEKKAA